MPPRFWGMSSMSGNDKAKNKLDEAAGKAKEGRT
jgi:uncharacterized protein YjbJ (UPF0337 family)